MADYFIKEGDDYKKVEQFTQENIDEITGDTNWLKNRLERERSKFSDYDDLKAKAAKVDTIESDFTTKLTEANTKIEDLTKTVGTKDLEIEKVKVIHEFNLEDDLAEFVSGDTPEEMRKRAEKLANGRTKGVHIDKKDKPEEKKTDAKRIAGDLFGRKKV